MVARAWRQIDAGLARGALAAVALCAGDTSSAAIAGAAALASVVPRQWQWPSALFLAASASYVASHSVPMFVAVLAAISLTTALAQYEQSWHELHVGADEGVILVQALTLGVWRGVLAASDAVSPPSPGTLSRRDASAAIGAAVALLVGGTCVTWALSLPVLWARTRKPRARSFGGLAWPEEIWVWLCVVGVVAGGEYPLLWLRLGVEPFSWALAVLCGTPALAGLVAWWCAVIAALLAWAPPQRGAARGAHTGVGGCSDAPAGLPLVYSPPAAAPQTFSDSDSPRTGAWCCAPLRRVATRLSPSRVNLLVRKLFHVAAVIMFAPALAVPGGSAALALAFACAAKVLCTLELLRCLRARPRWLSAAVQGYVRGFTDERDAGPLILTHIYLLLGCAGPLWVWMGSGGGGSSPARLAAAAAAGAAPLAGVAVLGAGDAAAAVIGIFVSALGSAHTWGSTLGAARRWWRGGDRGAAPPPSTWAGAGKTLEGSAAFVAATLLCLACVDGMLGWQAGAGGGLSSPWGGAREEGADSVGRWARVAGCAVLASLLETFTLAIDNATLPAAFYACVAW